MRNPLDPKIIGRLSTMYLAKMESLGNVIPNPLPESLLYGIMESFMLAEPFETCSICSGQQYLCDVPGLNHQKTCIICTECGNVIFNK
jgi:hypothetical protein